MERNLKETLHEIAAHTPKQNVYEIITILLPLEKELNITVSNYFLLIHDDPSELGPIPLDNILLVMVEDTHVFLLCHNDVIHSFDRRIHRHEAILPNEEKPSLRGMFLLMCESYLERWRMRGR